MSEHEDTAPDVRVVSVYNLTEQLQPRTDTSSLDTILDIGESQRYLKDPLGLLPRMLLIKDVRPQNFCGEIGALLSKVTVTVLRTPRGDPVILVEARFAGLPSLDDVVRYRAQMQEARDTITVADASFIDWLGGLISIPMDCRLGYGHSMIFAGSALASELLSVEPSLSSSVHTLLNDDEAFRRHNGRLELPGFRSPETLNARGTSLVAHTRGVSVVAGWNRRSEDKLTLVVILAIAALAVLYRSRIRAYRALEDHSRSQGESVEEARETLTSLADEMGEIQLDLSFGVEAYIDAVLVPDNLMQLFRASLYDQLAIDDAAANTARMVERLGTVIQSRGAALVAAGQEIRERKDRVLTALFAAVSVLAVPPTLLLAFFSVNSSDIDSKRSIFDLHRYWLAYVISWVPFTVLVVIGLLITRRVRTQPRPRRSRLTRRSQESRVL